MLLALALESLRFRWYGAEELHGADHGQQGVPIQDMGITVDSISLSVGIRKRNTDNANL